MKTTKKTKPNGKFHGRVSADDVIADQAARRKAKKPVGHTNRVAAIRQGKRAARGVSENVVPATPIPASVRTAPDRIRGRKPAYDGTPNYTEPQTETPIEIADSPITIDADLAPAQMREIAELAQEVVKAERVAEAKKEWADTAKKTVASKIFLLREKIRVFTHPPSLPLFDEKVESRAVTRMVQGEPISEQLDLSGDAAASNDDEETQPEPEAGSPEPETAPA